MSGGILLIGDASVHADGPERRRMFADWSLWMQSHGLTADEAEAHFAQWANEDHYVPIGAELGLVFDAGFPRPEYFWRQGGIAVYGGFKDS